MTRRRWMPGRWWTPGRPWPTRGSSARRPWASRRSIRARSRPGAGGCLRAHDGARPAGPAPCAPRARTLTRTVWSRGTSAAFALRDLTLVQRRGTVALAGREVRRVLTLWSQTIVPPVHHRPALSAGLWRRSWCPRAASWRASEYLSFILPGLVVMTVAGQAFANSATSLFQAKYEGHIEDILSSPMAAWRMAVAYMVGSLVRAGIAGGAAHRHRGAVHRPRARRRPWRSSVWR